MKIFAYLNKHTEYEKALNGLIAAEENLSFKTDKVFADIQNEYLQFQELLSSCQPGDVLLVPQFILLARLPKFEWQNLRNVTETGLNVVALNLTSTLRGLHISSSAERLASRASTETLMELAENAISYVQSNPEFAKRKLLKGSSAGRPVNTALHHHISLLLMSGASYSEIQKQVKCSRTTISRVKQTMPIHKPNENSFSDL